MSRALLLCPEPLGHRNPAGVGIRFIEIARELRRNGFDVTLLSRDGGAIDDVTCDITSPSSIHEWSRKSEVAIIQGHIANDFFAHGAAIPTVIDLYDPFIIENLHYSENRNGEVFSHDHATFVRSAARGDYFVCASETQRQFYLGFLLAVGRLSPEQFHRDHAARSLIDLAPFGVAPPRPAAPRSAPRGARVLFGGIYDWYDPILAIDAVAALRRRHPGATLTFNRHPNVALTPQSAAAAAERYVRERGYGDFVEFVPWISYEKRGEFFDRFDAALLTFPQSIETDLSMRTRVYDFMWAGLPIVSSSARGTDELLQKYGTGLTVAGDAAAYASALSEVLSNDDRYCSLSSGGERFVREHQWAEVLKPLVRFCENPRVDTSKPRELAPEVTASGTVRQKTILERIRRRLRGRA